MPKYLQILSLVILLLVLIKNNISAQVGNVTGISISGNTLNLQCGTDLVVFRVCTENVILIDLRPFSELREAQDRMDYFMGASRARQLLAVVHSSGGPVEK